MEGQFLILCPVLFLGGEGREAVIFLSVGSQMLAPWKPFISFIPFIGVHALVCMCTHPEKLQRTGMWPLFRLHEYPLAFSILSNSALHPAPGSAVSLMSLGDAQAPQRWAALGTFLCTASPLDRSPSKPHSTTEPRKRRSLSLKIESAFWESHSCLIKIHNLVHPVSSFQVMIQGSQWAGWPETYLKAGWGLTTVSNCFPRLIQSVKYQGTQSM